MHIKRFEADSMEEVLEEIRSVFGPDALILSSRTIQKGRTALGLFSRKRVEVQAASPRSIKALDSSAARTTEATEITETKENQPDLASMMGEVRLALRGLALRREFEDEMRGELRGLRTALDRRFEQANEGRCEAAIEPAVGHLMRLGLDWSNAEPLALAWHEARSEGVDLPIERGLADKIESRLIPPRVSEEPMLRILVGAPGVGKTTTLAKLAARTEEGEGEIALVSLDPYRIGAEAQLRQYAALLDTPFEAIDRSEGLGSLHARHPEHRIFVDTAGRSTGLDEEMMHLQALRDQTERPVSIEWVVDATTRLEVQRAQLERFKDLAPDRVILTKVDECEDLRGPLNLLLTPDCPPLSWLGNGQRVPEDLEMAEIDHFQPKGQAWLQ